MPDPPVKANTLRTAARQVVHFLPLPTAHGGERGGGAEPRSMQPMFSWKGEEWAEWNGMEVQRMRGSSAQDDLLSEDAGSEIAAAASSGNVARLIELLTQEECFVNDLDHMGNTPLHHAVLNDRPDAVRALLSRGANPDLHNDRGRSPMHAASARGDHSACAQLLVDAGASIATCGIMDQQTPLEYARLASCSGVAAVLLEAAHRPRPPWQSEQQRQVATISPLTHSGWGDGHSALTW